MKPYEKVIISLPTDLLDKISEKAEICELSFQDFVIKVLDQIPEKDFFSLSSSHLNVNYEQE